MKLYKKKVITLLWCSILPLTIFAQPTLECPPYAKITDDRPLLTIFIHGTSRPFLTVKDFFKVLHGTAHNSLYNMIVNTMRNDRFFYQAQPMQDIGLHKVDLHDLTPGKAASLTAAVHEKLNKKVRPHAPEGIYYTYGWSGLLSVGTRRKAAEQLYDELNAVLKTYGEKKPIVRIIGYSHGGNVGLYLSEIEFTKKQNLVIDELILIGTPIQKDTDYLANTPMFGHIYNLYSTGDLVQTVDFLSSARHSLGRHTFQSRRGFHIPTNLTQLRIRVIGSTCHRRQRGKLCEMFNPGHTELWFYGWAQEWYRKTFPLNPLSIASFIPLLVDAAQQYCHWGKIRTDIDACNGDIITYHQRCAPKIALHYLTTNELRALQKFVLDHKPLDYEANYKAAVARNIAQAKQYYRKIRNTNREYELAYCPAKQCQIAKKSLIVNC